MTLRQHIQECEKALGLYGDMPVMCIAPGKDPLAIEHSRKPTVYEVAQSVTENQRVTRIRLDKDQSKSTGVYVLVVGR